jgi:GntR family transcriptional regulator of arabinose operon
MDNKPPLAAIDGQSHEPSYQQLARILAQNIVSQEWPAGSRMPQERELSERYHLSRFTVRNALDVLEAQGLIQRVRGKGTFVAGGSSGKRWFSTASTIQFVHVGATGHTASPPTDGYYGGILGGVRQMTRALGLQLQVQGIRSYVRISLDEYRPPKSDQVGGVIVCGVFDEQYIRMFGSEGVPVVSVDLWSHDPNVDSVVVDVESDAHTVIDHLAEKGHTSLGFVATGRHERGGDTFEYDPDIWRILDNLRRVAQRRRIEMRDEWIRMPVKSRTQPYQTARELLNLRVVPTAILCFDDGAALPVLKAIEDAGLRCPEDISVISRGIEAEADGLITRLLSDPDMLGRQAVKLLVERMQGQRHRAVKLAAATRLALGRSTGPAPDR